jgi:hypothetical protein
MKKLLPLIISIVFITSCSTVKVTADLDKDADFSKYKTASFLGWQEDSDKVLNDIDKKRLRDAFTTEFSNRNITLVEENGDMAITLFLVADQKTSVTAYSNYYGGGGGYGRYGRGRGGWGGGYSSTSYNETDYLQGTLVVDVFDNASGDMVWQAVATGTIQEKPDKREKSIPKSVTALMKEFPIAPTN